MRMKNMIAQIHDKIDQMQSLEVKLTGICAGFVDEDGERCVWGDPGIFLRNCDEDESPADQYPGAFK